jgi:putative flippase GtrA
MHELNIAPSSRRNENSLLSQVVRFTIVGLVNTTIDLAALNTLIFLTARGRSGVLYSLFKAVSFTAAVANSYWMNSKWTFSQPMPGIASRQAGRFLSISLLGLATNVGIASWVASFSRLAPIAGHRELVASWPSVAALAGSSCSLAFNFAGYKYLVFSGSRRPLASRLRRSSSSISQQCVAVGSYLSVEEAEMDLG